MTDVGSNEKKSSRFCDDFTTNNIVQESYPVKQRNLCGVLCYFMNGNNVQIILFLNRSVGFKIITGYNLEL